MERASPSVAGGGAAVFPVRASRIGLPLSAKLIFGFLLVTIPSLGVMVAISLIALRDLASVTHQLQEISRSLEAVERLEAALGRAVTPLGAYLVEATPGAEQHFQESIRAVETQLKDCSAAACHGNSRQPEAMTAGLLPHIQGLKVGASIIFAPSNSLGATNKIRALYEVNRERAQAGRLLNRMSSQLILRVTSLEEESRQVNRRATTRIVASVTLVLMLAAMTAYWLSRWLLRHLGELLVGTQRVMQGDLGYRVAATQHDEIGQLAQSFNAMAKEMQQHRDNLQRTVEAKSAELKQAHDSLIQSEKLASIGLLASGVAHELNNPLTSILMNVNLLMEDAGDQPSLKAELQRINEDTVRCKRIIDDLRDFSRRQELELVPTDLNRLVEDALAQICRRQDPGGVAVACEFPGGIPAVACDPVRMEQVLANVFVNAIQAMPQGGTLAVKTALRGYFAEISVQDTGSGIPDEIRSRIFDPFFTTKPQGTGLGLSIVYSIMEAHGGRVEVESPAQQDPREGAPRQGGTTVRLFLPLKRSTAGIATASIGEAG